jgi:3-methyladenine DNA glycosylase Mpg
MGITTAQYGVDVTRGSLVVREPGEHRAVEIKVTPRINVNVCSDWPLRFIVKGSRFVSGNRKLNLS